MERCAADLPAGVTLPLCPVDSLNSLAGIRAVTFDVGGTLITPWPSVGAVYAETAARLGYGSFAPELLDQRFRAAWTRCESFNHTRAEWAALVDATFEGLLNPAPSGTFFNRLYDRFSEPEVWHVYDDVLPVLPELRKLGFKLGVISNWDERLRPLLQRLDLAVYFDSIVVSSELGCLKPAPRIFQTAQAELACQPESLVHIGDSLKADVLGAEAAESRAFWLQREPGPARVNVLRSLTELTGPR
jgi:putative hydrolase of the HAD superfamily